MLLGDDAQGYTCTICGVFTRTAEKCTSLLTCLQELRQDMAMDKYSKVEETT